VATISTAGETSRGDSIAQGLRQFAEITVPNGPFPTFPASAYDTLLPAGPRSKTVTKDSAARFTARTDLPFWEVDQSLTRQLGGEGSIQLILSAQARLSAEWVDALQPHCSTTIAIGNVSGAFLTQRVLHVGASKVIGAPVWQYTEGFVMIVHSTLPATDASVLTVGSDGIKEILSLTGTNWLTETYKEPTERRLVAYPDDLVTWYKADKVYSPVTSHNPTNAAQLDDMFGATFLGQAHWEALTLGDWGYDRPVDDEKNPKALTGVAEMLPQQDPEWPDSGPPPPKGPARGVYEDPATGVVMQGVEAPIGITMEGNTGQVGFGPESGSSLSYGSCTHYTAADSCKGCCTSIMTTGLSGVLGAGIACHTVSSVCIPCHIVCGVVETALTLVLVLGNETCQKNCEAPVSW